MAALSILSSPAAGSASQDASGLFTQLPAEIRLYIFNLCVTECEDLTKRYPRNALWNRPGHFGPRTTYTDILRTCKRAYHEAWFLPWKSTSLTIYLAAWDRRPARSANPFVLEEQLKTLDQAVEFDNLQIFAQLYMLEPGGPLQEVLDLPNFLPKSITVTIRHTDFWQWEMDDPLHIDATWAGICRMPNSVREVVVKLETLERKRAQAEYLASQMISSWFFTRRDGTRLTATEATAERWTGSSTLNQSRWLRDETRPSQLDYYVAIIPFNLDKNDSGEMPAQPDLTVPPELSAPFQAPGIRVSSFTTETLRSAAVSAETPAREAIRMIAAYQQAETARMQQRYRRRTFDAEDDEWITDSDDELERRDDQGNEVPSAHAHDTSDAEQDHEGDEPEDVDSDEHDDNDGDDDILVFPDYAPEVAAFREADEMQHDHIINEDRELDLIWLPGHPERHRGSGRFGGSITAYEWQYWRRKYFEWRKRAVGMDREAGDRLRNEMLPFWVPPEYCNVLDQRM